VNAGDAESCVPSLRTFASYELVGGGPVNGESPQVVAGVIIS